MKLAKWLILTTQTNASSSSTLLLLYNDFSMKSNKQTTFNDFGKIPCGQQLPILSLGFIISF